MGLKALEEVCFVGVREVRIFSSMWFQLACLRDSSPNVLAVDKRRGDVLEGVCWNISHEDSSWPKV